MVALRYVLYEYPYYGYYNLNKIVQYANLKDMNTLIMSVIAYNLSGTRDETGQYEYSYYEY